MYLLSMLLLSFSPLVMAGEIISFKKSETYQVEGVMEEKFFVFNGYTNNVQRMLLKSNKGMVDGAQYSVCLQVLKDCHMECEAKIKGTPKFITPDLEPALLIPNHKGSYAPATKAQCP